MATSEKELVDLRQRILAAFPKTAPPAPEDLTPHRCEECDEVRDTFSGGAWWSAQENLIDEQFGVLPLFSPEAYHYYLPAFLLRALETFDADSSVLEFAIYSLTHAEMADDPWYHARLNQFSSEQASVIASLLGCVLRDEELYVHYADAEIALRKFWHRPSPEVGK